MNVSFSITNYLHEPSTHVLSFKITNNFWRQDQLRLQRAVTANQLNRCLTCSPAGMEANLFNHATLATCSNYVKSRPQIQQILAQSKTRSRLHSRLATETTGTKYKAGYRMVDINSR